MTHDISRIAARLFNAPLLVLPDTAVTIASNLAARLGIEPMRSPDPKASAWGDDDGSDGAADDKPYEIVDGVATVAVRGELVNRGSWLDAFSGLTSYERLSVTLRAAAADPLVSGIVLDLDSPGGEAAGAIEAAAVVREVSKVKTVVAFVNSTAASAAYAIAAGADKIVVTPSAMIGSIGVVWLHMDHSEMLKEAGVKPTLLHAGAFKVDGNPLNPLAPAAAKRIQATIASYYDLFVDSVGKHRPSLGAEGARNTEAGVFVGQAGVDAGLADRVGDLESVLRSFPQPKSPPFRVPNGAKSMSLKTEDAGISQSALDAAVANALATGRSDGHAAGRAEGHAEGVALGRAEGWSAERARVAAILRSPEAEGRGATALTLALDNDMAPEAAIKVLGSVPKGAEATPPRGGFLDAHVPRPAVKPDGGGGGAKTEVDRGQAAALHALGKSAG